MATVTIYREESGGEENPRQWDNLGHMACWHSRYTLGDEQPTDTPSAYLRDLRAARAIVLPLYLFDHSGLTISTSDTMFRAWDAQGWDWGQVGFIAVSAARVRTEYHVRRVSRKLRAQVEDVLRAEVRQYDLWLRGHVYGYYITGDSGEIIDACGGFLGDTLEETGMLDACPEEYRDAVRHAWKHRTW